MDKKQERRELFLRHAEDLHRVCPSTQDRFVCSTCFRVFMPADLDKENTLSIGHIWPGNFFRAKSAEADKHVVLLCDSCNSRGGDTYDAAMQEIERFRESQRTGEPFARRFVSIFLPHNPSRKRIRMGLFVIERKGGLSSSDMELVVRSGGIAQKYGDVELGLFPLIDEAGRKHYNTDDWGTAKEYLCQGASVAIEPFDSDWEKGRISKKPILWRVGLLTSAYLYAFRTFGYRYIFQSCLDPIRDYIGQASTRQKIVANLAFAPGNSINVARYTAFYEDPDIGFFNPYGSGIPHHIRIHFLDYAIWLPTRYEGVFTADMPANNAEGLMASAKEHHPHNGDPCIWEAILGETDYIIQNDRVILRSIASTQQLDGT
jgi:hypothetical protein